jgi:Zn-dependent protease
MGVHEFARAWVADKLGAISTRYPNRLTLNPIAHFNLMGMIILPLVFLFTTNGRYIFGAARPLPIKFWALKNPRGGMIRIGISGLAANFILAVAAGFVYKYAQPDVFLGGLLKNFITINVALVAFNLLPIPSLDGARILMGLLPHSLDDILEAVELYGFLILIALLASGAVNYTLIPLVNSILELLLT